MAYFLVSLVVLFPPSGVQAKKRGEVVGCGNQVPLCGIPVWDQMQAWAQARAECPPMTKNGIYHRHLICLLQLAGLGGITSPGSGSSASLVRAGLAIVRKPSEHK